MDKHSKKSSSLLHYPVLVVFILMTEKNYPRTVR